ncbi:FeoB-associated Cys-rich membrane protein [Clostridium sp.]|uniref:FeoB-associated Cys-rich membrane protein n=1 Tax=Clostridium sp. TaxID=1506 RepID=UPI002625743B|nr:FeoB-associated Cys-rich membrane protein [Clostridium sp.]
MATFIIGAIVFALLFLAVLNMFKKSKNNSDGCGCGCSGCSIKKSCNSNIKFKHK